jgi:hypothetical protein
MRARCLRAAPAHARREQSGRAVAAGEHRALAERPDPGGRRPRGGVPRGRVDRGGPGAPRPRGGRAAAALASPRGGRGHGRLSPTATGPSTRAGRLRPADDRGPACRSGDVRTAARAALVRLAGADGPAPLAGRGARDHRRSGRPARARRGPARLARRRARARALGRFGAAAQLPLCLAAPPGSAAAAGRAAQGDAEGRAAARAARRCAAASRPTTPRTGSSRAARPAATPRPTRGPPWSCASISRTSSPR